MAADPVERAPVPVVLIHRNRPDAIGATVAAFRGQTVPTSVIVVDNGSDPEVVDRLPRLVGAEAELVLTGRNLGFGPGANVGLRRFLRWGSGAWVALAPHDAIPDPDAIEQLLAAGAAHADVGLVSADVGDGKRPVVQPYLGAIDAEPTVDRGFDESDYPHGTLMLCRRACLDDIGLFDERYFAYCEETDLGLRAARAGWRCGIVRGAMVRNPGMSASIARVAYLQLRNTLLLLREHFGRRQAWFRIAVALLQLPIGAIHPPSRGLHWSPRGRLLGIRDHLRGRYGPPPSSLDPH
jgi:N-acetylglucosaminyl-diphospho-decaprenol L-rhamnosyltransferase